MSYRDKLCFEMASDEFVLNEKCCSYVLKKLRIKSPYTQGNIMSTSTSSRTLKSAVRDKRISADDVKKKKSKYYDLQYSCIRGGKNYKSRSSGTRSTKTFQKQCLCSVSFRLSDDGNHLILSKLHLEHGGHDTSRDTYKFYPKVRKLDDDDRKYADDMLAIGANLKKLQNQLSIDTGKAVHLKDLRNIAQTSKRNQITKLGTT